MADLNRLSWKSVEKAVVKMATDYSVLSQVRVSNDTASERYSYLTERSAIR